MADYETLCKLQNIKIKLLEDFINESDRLANLYEWQAVSEDMEKLNSLSIQLDDITEYIKDLSDSSSVGRV